MSALGAFATLPLEIRLMIYKEANVSPKPVHICTGCKQAHTKGLSPGLLSTSRAIYYEARPYLYSKNTFVLTANAHNIDSAVCNVAVYVARLLTNIYTLDNIRRIRSVIFVYNDGALHWRSWRSALLNLGPTLLFTGEGRKIVTTLAPLLREFKSLTKLTFAVRKNSGPFDEDELDEIERPIPAFEYLANLFRGAVPAAGKGMMGEKDLGEKLWEELGNPLDREDNHGANMEALQWLKEMCVSIGNRHHEKLDWAEQPPNGKKGVKGAAKDGREKSEVKRAKLDLKDTPKDLDIREVPIMCPKRNLSWNKNIQYQAQIEWSLED